ncbi:GntR family transcriptional regulator [Pseudomonas sp. NPDC087346]|uniref:GntR family transcriptional regulator n=1 Tax=Pseudomonas sp. NPDC087346 TaxID=3364438 RepID=UPI0037F6C241
MNSFATPARTRQITTALHHLDSHTVEDDLYARVFDAILEQRITSSSHFTPQSLAQMFDAPRSVIQRVLTRLAHQQVVILRPNHRPTITATDQEQARQVLHARRLAESTVVQIFCERHRPHAISRLREKVRQQRLCLTQGQQGPAIRLSGEFHLMLAELAGNRPLTHFLGSLVPLTSLLIAQDVRHADPHLAADWHATIIDALERSDQQLTTKLMQQYLHKLELILTTTTL